MSDLRRRRTPSERLFGALLLLFPLAFRSRFGDDMRELFRDQVAEARRRAGRAGVLRLWLRTIPATIRAAMLERRDTRPMRQRARAGLTHMIGSRDMLANLAADLRLAARMLRKSPVFTLVAALVIALGSGAVTTIFSAVNALVLRPLPATTDGDRLVFLQRAKPGFEERVSASHLLYQRVRDARTLDGVAAWSNTDLAIATGRGDAVSTLGNLVSGNYFSVLGVRPALGRFFLPEEDAAPMAHPVVVVSHAFWRTRLGADSGVVGRTVTVSGRPYTIVGVAAEGFHGVFTPLAVEAWAPIAMQPHLAPDRDLQHKPWLWMFGRLKDGVTDAAARAEVGALMTAHARAGGEASWATKYTDVLVYPLTGLPDDARKALLAFAAVLLAAALLLLLIAGVNVAAMLSARALARAREMAVRSALGAPRSRLVRQLLVETLALFLLGGAGGAALAWIATGALERIPVPGGEAFTLELSPDLRALGFALGVSLLAGLVVGTAPALRAAGGDVATRLRDGAAGAGSRRSRAGRILVAGQVACSLVLLVTAGLFVRALDRGARLDPGFARAGVATVLMNAESWGYDEAKARAFHRALRERVEAVPGVTAVSYAAHLPLTFNENREQMGIDGRDSASVNYVGVDAGYFGAISLPLLRGRGHQVGADGAAAAEVVINETMARRRWPGGEAIGRTIQHGGRTLTIVGVARDARYSTLSEAQTPEMAYTPLDGAWRTRVHLIARTDTDVASLAAQLRAAALALDPSVPPPVVTTLADETSIALLPQRVAAMVTGAIGATGLLLSTIGLYGVVAFSVSRRRRELGIRVALGARRIDVLRLVVREGMKLALGGAVLGLVLAVAASPLMRAYLFDVSPLDPVTFGLTTALLVGVALVASWLPARRAAGADPVEVLRGE